MAEEHRSDDSCPSRVDNIERNTEGRPLTSVAALVKPAADSPQMNPPFLSTYHDTQSETQNTDRRLFSIMDNHGKVDPVDETCHKGDTTHTDDAAEAQPFTLRPPIDQADADRHAAPPQTAPAVECREKKALYQSVLHQMQQQQKHKPGRRFKKKTLMKMAKMFVIAKGSKGDLAEASAIKRDSDKETVFSIISPDTTGPCQTAVKEKSKTVYLKEETCDNNELSRHSQAEMSVVDPPKKLNSKREEKTTEKPKVGGKKRRTIQKPSTDSRDAMTHDVTDAFLVSDTEATCTTAEIPKSSKTGAVLTSRRKTGRTFRKKMPVFMQEVEITAEQWNASKRRSSGTRHSPKTVIDSTDTSAQVPLHTGSQDCAIQNSEDKATPSRAKKSGKKRISSSGPECKRARRGVQQLSTGEVCLWEQPVTGPSKETSSSSASAVAESRIKNPRRRAAAAKTFKAEAVNVPVWAPAGDLVHTKSGIKTEPGAEPVTQTSVQRRSTRGHRTKPAEKEKKTTVSFHVKEETGGCDKQCGTFNLKQQVDQEVVSSNNTDAKYKSRGQRKRIKVEEGSNDQALNSDFTIKRISNMDVGTGLDQSRSRPTNAHHRRTKLTRKCTTPRHGDGFMSCLKGFRQNRRTGGLKKDNMSEQGVNVTGSRIQASGLLKETVQEDVTSEQTRVKTRFSERTAQMEEEVTDLKNVLMLSFEVDCEAPSGASEWEETMRRSAKVRRSNLEMDDKPEIRGAGRKMKTRSGKLSEIAKVEDTLSCKEPVKEELCQSQISESPSKGTLLPAKTTGRQKMHSGPAPFSCARCGGSFSSFASLRSHQVDRVCASDIDGFLVSRCAEGQIVTPLYFKCPLCKQLHRHWCQYVLHLRTHTQSECSTCTTCKQQYDQAAGSRSHCAVCCTQSGEERACRSSLTEIWKEPEAPEARSGNRAAPDADPTAQTQTSPNSRAAEDASDCASLTSPDRPPQPCRFRPGPFIRRHEMKVSCGHCGKSVNQRNKLWPHQRLRRQTSAPFSCAHCDLEFRFLGSYVDHLREHAAQTPCACPLCPVTLAHISECHKQHSYKKCNTCGKIFSTLGNLKRHKLLHKGANSRFCLPRDPSFSSSGASKRHLKAHRPQLSVAPPAGVVEPLLFPHHCDRCTATFSSADLLQAHQICHFTAESRTQTHPGRIASPQKRRLPASNKKHLFRYPHPDRLYVVPVVSSEPPVVISDREEEDQLIATSFLPRSHPDLAFSASDSDSSEVASTESELEDEAHRCAVCTETFPDVSELHEHYVEHARGGITS